MKRSDDSAEARVTQSRDPAARVAAAALHPGPHDEGRYDVGKSREDAAEPRALLPRLPLHRLQHRQDLWIAVEKGAYQHYLRHGECRGAYRRGDPVRQARRPRGRLSCSGPREGTTNNLSPASWPPIANLSERLGRNHQAPEWATIRWCWHPSSSMPSSTTSPTLSQTGSGLMPMPTPGGVPVAMISPGRSVM